MPEGKDPPHKDETPAPGRIAAPHRVAHGGCIEHVAVKPGDVEVIDAAGVRAFADHDTHVSARGDELPGDVRT